MQSRHSRRPSSPSRRTHSWRCRSATTCSSSRGATSCSCRGCAGRAGASTSRARPSSRCWEPPCARLSVASVATATGVSGSGSKASLDSPNGRQKCIGGVGRGVGKGSEGAGGKTTGVPKDENRDCVSCCSGIRDIVLLFFSDHGLAGGCRYFGTKGGSLLPLSSRSRSRSCYEDRRHPFLFSYHVHL